MAVIIIPPVVMPVINQPHQMKPSEPMTPHEAFLFYLMVAWIIGLTAILTGVLTSFDKYERLRWGLGLLAYLGVTYLVLWGFSTNWSFE